MKLTVRRAAAAVTAGIFLLGTWLLYRQEFPALRTETEKAAVTADYVKPSGIVILRDAAREGYRVMTFTDGTGQLLGNIQFRRGILGGWQPVRASYTYGDAVGTDTVGDTDLLIVYANGCPAEAVHYKVQANPDNPGTLMAEGDVTEPCFLHIYETDRKFFPAIHLYDREGRELDWGEYQKSSGSASVGSAEINLVYWLCALLLGVGWLAVKYLWDQGKMAEPSAGSAGEQDALCERNCGKLGE